MTMNKDGMLKLSPTQKACLRAVLLHNSSKEIARQSGMSPHTVDNHIKAAMSRLGAASRVEAARWLAEFEANDDNQTLASQSPALSQAPLIPPHPIDSNVQGLASKSDEVEFREIRQLYVAEEHERPQQIRLPLPQYWGDTNDLTATQKAAWIFIITTLTCFSIAAITASLTAVQGLI